MLAIWRSSSKDIRPTKRARQKASLLFMAAQWRSITSPHRARQTKPWHWPRKNSALTAIALSPTSTRRQAAGRRPTSRCARPIIALTIGLILLALLTMAFFYIASTRRRHMRQLSAAYQHALEADKMKTRFIQNVSHEVRTPLNIISGFSQVIADPTLTESVEERQHMASMMQKSAMQITNLIDEILGLSLIESSATIAKEDVVHVNQLLQTIVKEYQETAPPIDLRFDSQLESEFAIKTNRNMLSRIIHALTDNALKNTEKGSITLKAKTVAQTLILTVEDTGCGIPADQAEHIFERFVKLDSFKQGIGLGLPLSRKLAEQLGGIITLDTSYSPGARFVVTLPFEEAEG